MQRHARVFGLALGLGFGLASVGCDEADETGASVRDQADAEGDEDDEDDADALDVEASCEALASVDACHAQVGCMAIYAEPLRERGDGSSCTDDARFVACARTLDPCPNTDKVDCEPCPAIGSVYCDEQGAWLASGCSMPDAMQDCQAPGPIVGACE